MDLRCGHEIDAGIVPSADILAPGALSRMLKSHLSASEPPALTRMQFLRGIHKPSKTTLHIAIA